MLSKRELQILRVVTKCANCFCTVPYKWNAGEERYIFCDGRVRKIIWSVHNLVYILYLFFVLGRWIQFAFFLASPFAPVTMGTLYVFCCYNMVPAIQWSLWRNYGQHHSWMNIYLELAKEFESARARDVAPSSGKINKKTKNANCSRVLTSFISGCLLVFVLDTLSVFAMPRAPWFISSLFLGEVEGENEKWIVRACALFHISIWIHQHASIYFYVSCIVCYLTTIKNILQHLKLVENCRISPWAIEGQSRNFRLKSPEILNFNPSININGRPSSTILELELEPDSEGHIKKNPRDGAGVHSRNTKANTLMTQFSRLQAVQLFSNSLWSVTNCSYLLVFLIGVILACYGAVKLDGARAVHQFVVAILITLHLLHMVKNMGDVFEVSRAVLKSWIALVKDDVWFRSAVRSKRPLTVNIGGFFYADRAMKLTLLSTIFENTCSLLVST